MLTLLLYVLCAFFLIHDVAAIGQETCVVFQQSSGGSTFPVVQNGAAVPVFVSPDEWPGVQRAASDFVSDIELVTQLKPTLSNVSASGTTVNSSQAIIVGTLGKSSLIDQIVNNTQLDVSSIQGLWESFLGMEVANPLPGVDSAYVIIGSDKRGTIFAMYDLSEQFGKCFQDVFVKSPNYNRELHFQGFRRGFGAFSDLWACRFRPPTSCSIYKVGGCRPDPAFGTFHNVFRLLSWPSYCSN